MTGLRAQNKADKRRRILESASRLFRAAGFESVRIEDIALDAGMSPGTVYNHFATKGDILLAIVSMEVEEVLALGDAHLATAAGSFEQDMGALIGSYYDHSLMYLSKAMWRTAMAQAISAPDAAFSQHYTGLDRRLTNQICSLITRLQAQGSIRADVSARTLGELVFNDINQMFAEFIKEEQEPLTDLKDAVSAHLGLMACLLCPPIPATGA